VSTLSFYNQSNLWRDNTSPLSQFEIRDLINIDTPVLGNLHISMTNIGFYLTIGAIFLLVLNLLTTNYNKLGGNNWSISQESLYATIHSIVTNQINPKNGQIYFPFIFALFIFILINNLIGMVNSKYYGYLVDRFFTSRSLIISNTNKMVSGHSYPITKYRKYSTSSSVNYKTKDISVNDLHPYYFTGFIDGEGCFNLTISKNSELAVGWHVIPTFKISLHNKDRALLEYIQRWLGVGNIYKHGKNSLDFRVNGLKNLNIIIKHLDSYPLITQKFADFVLFKEAVKLIGLREHLTKEGLLKLVSLKASLNKGLSDKLKSEFSGVIPAERPKVFPSKILDFKGLALNTGLAELREECLHSKPLKYMNWLRGFVEAEGSFHIINQKVEGKTWVSLRFTLTQHSRDKVLMENLIKILGCGRCSSPSNRKEVNFIVSTYSDISKIIIPLFQEYPLLGFKQKDFLDFAKAADIIKSKNHLTKEGLARIMDIKNTMNQRRPVTVFDCLQSDNLVVPEEKIPVIV
jgi:LAGLIDADG DNA endonuclease family protein/ATP synthase A subunit